MLGPLCPVRHPWNGESTWGANPAGNNICLANGLEPLVDAPGGGTGIAKIRGVIAEGAIERPSEKEDLMRRVSNWMACLGCALALSSPTSSASARTSVSVDLHFGDRYRGPDVVFYDEPDVVVVPGTRVYYVPDYDYDVYRCGRYWYYNYDDGWYRSRSYRGPWIYVGYRSVPRQIGYMPYRYRRHWREFRDEPRYRYRAREWRDRDGDRDRDRDRQDRDRHDRDRDRWQTR